MTQQLSYKQIAIKILEDAKSALHYREITKRAIDNGLLKTEGATPWATMNAQLSMDIINNADLSPFIRTEPGVFCVKGD